MAYRRQGLFVPKAKFLVKCEMQNQTKILHLFWGRVGWGQVSSVSYLGEISESWLLSSGEHSMHL